MRRTKHRRRFHTGRVISNRRRRGRTLEKNDWWREHPPENGRLRDRFYFRGCGVARCGLCHPHKRWGGDRTREKRAWEREVAEDLA